MKTWSLKEESKDFAAYPMGRSTSIVHGHYRKPSKKKLIYDVKCWLSRPHYEKQHDRALPNLSCFMLTVGKDKTAPFLHAVDLH